MTVPVIGLTTNHGKNEYGHPTIYLLQAYVQALIDAGGAATLIPSDLTEAGQRALYERLDGILFTGGGDIGVEHFHGEPHPKIGKVEADRDALELSLLKTTISGNKPFLGICRGFQLVNVGMGGTLYTHIADQMPGAQKHDYSPDYPRDYLAHPVRVEKGTHLARILGELSPSVNSLHHQGANEIGPGLKAAAFAPDGLLEAVELPDHPFGLAVQWHPEWLPGQEHSRRLFRAFVEAAGGNR